MLIKQGIDISFAKGLDTKTDPKRVMIGNFAQLENSVFDKGGLLQKRNGYAQLQSLPNNEQYTSLTTFNNNLTAIGTTVAAYDNPNSSWVYKGNIQPLNLKTLPIIRNNFNQINADVAIAPNGLACCAYLESNGTVTTNKYVIFDSNTGQNITAPTIIPVVSGSVVGGMKTFVLGVNFIIVFTNIISSTAHLQYITVNIQNPTLVSTNTDIASSYIPAPTVSWDGYVVGNNLYIAYNTTTGGQAIKVTYLTNYLTLATAHTFTGAKASIMSVTADITNPSNPYIYISFYSAATSTGYTAILNSLLNLIMNPVNILSGNYCNITSSAQNGICTVFTEVINAYSFDNNLPTNYVSAIQVIPTISTFHSVFSSGITTITASSASGLVNGMFIVDNTTPTNIAIGTDITVSGTTLTLNNATAGNSASSPGDVLTSVTLISLGVIIRSVGLASKSFIVNGVIYFLSVYESSYQTTYFLINGSDSRAATPLFAAKLAYENGGGYITTGLPGVVLNGNSAFIVYLFKDLIQAVNKGTAVPTGMQTAGVYSQTGLNLVQFDIGTQNIQTIQIGNSLLISGGFLWMYDGYLPVEQNFVLWPDVDTDNPTDQWSWTTSAVTPTGTFADASFSVTLSSASGVAVGMTIADTTNSTYIPVGTVITSLNGFVATISQATTHSGTSDNLSISGSMASKPDGSTYQNAYFYQYTYEWTDNQGNAHKSAPSIPVAVSTANNSDTSGSVTLSIPTLRLTMKTANPVKIVVYRWSVAQQIYYQTTSISNPLLNDTTVDFVTFVDPNSDATILGNNILYTEGGIVEDVNGPASNIFAIFDDRAWLVDAEDPNLLWYSKQVIEATPVEMSDLFTIYVPPATSTQNSTGPITSLFPMDDKLIIGKKDAFLYINGIGPDNTGSNSQYSNPLFITSTVGCANQSSLVLTPTGLMFQSDKGIWLLDRGLGTSYIGAPVENFTTSAIVTSAVNVPGTNQVRFTLNTGITLMYDYYYEQWGTFVGIPAISSCIFQEFHTLMNDFGQIYQENPNSYLDGDNPVLMMLQTGPIRLGELQNYQRAFFFYILGTYLSPHKLQVNLSYDYESNPSQTVLISPNNYSTSFGSGANQSPYGQGTPYGGPTNIEKWRVFLQRQRCMAIQIQVQEIFDPTFGTIAGAGFTLSGLNVVVAFKKAFRPQSAAESIG